MQVVNLVKSAEQDKEEFTCPEDPQIQGRMLVSSVWVF